MSQNQHVREQVYKCPQSKRRGRLVITYRSRFLALVYRIDIYSQSKICVNATAHIALHSWINKKIGRQQKIWIMQTYLSLRTFLQDMEIFLHTWRCAEHIGLQEAELANSWWKNPFFHPFLSLSLYLSLSHSLSLSLFFFFSSFG